MNAAWVALVGGAAAFAHCLGMCGGFALHLARGASRWRVLGHQALWHAGRLATYVFLGALAGFLGRWAGAGSRLATAQNILAYAAGAVMVLMGIGLLGLRPRLRRANADRGVRSTECKSEIRNPKSEIGIVSLFRQLLQEPSATRALALGVATGFLPCPIVYGFLAFAAQAGSVASGMLVMGAMGIGTAWSLLALGMTGQMVTARLRRWGSVAAGVVLVALGVATALRGTEAFHHLLGCPAHQAENPKSEIPNPKSKSCCEH